MPTIQLTGSDSAAIALALISDHINEQQAIPLPQLENEWRKLGLRSDDLIQGIATLRRNKKLELENGSTKPFLRLSKSTIAALPATGKGLASLNPHLHSMLEAAEARQTHSRPSNNLERRNGFK